MRFAIQLRSAGEKAAAKKAEKAAAIAAAQRRCVCAMS